MGGSVYTGLSQELGGREKAASSNAPTMLPRFIHPKLPPCRALSSLYSSATLENDIRSSLILASASNAFASQTGRLAKEECTLFGAEDVSYLCQIS